MKTHRPLSRLTALTLALLCALPAAAATAPKKVLMVTVTAGFRHSCIPLSEEIVTQLAKESGKFTVDFVRQPADLPKPPARPRQAKGEDAAAKAAMEKYAADEKVYQAALMPKLAQALQKLSPANLKNYDAVIFASTTGDLPLPDKQGFVDWIASGKGFIGVHAAADTFEKTARFAGFPPYITMLGGAFMTHGPQVSVDCNNEDPAHAACKHLPKTWTLFDEIYEFKEFERSKVHGLLSLDKHPQNKAPGYHGIAWNKMHGKGRVFYTALGHREDVWDPNYKDNNGARKNPPEIAKQFQQHVLGGILWALGLAPGDAKPKK
ncbi:MAG: ThuA domain-containing protein [Opitutaceae bacterium]|nr:ThuA domain-containing protein [Opitutaceae bacterium]